MCKNTKIYDVCTSYKSICTINKKSRNLPPLSDHYKTGSFLCVGLSLGVFALSRSTKNTLPKTNRKFAPENQ